MIKTIDKIIEYGLLLFVFLIPWQARLILQDGSINRGYWEYGTKSLYATEVLLLIILLAVIIRGARNVYKHKPRFQAKRLIRPIGALGLLILWAGFSIIWAYDVSIAFERWIVLIEAIVVFLMLCSGIVSFKKLSWAIILSGLIQAMFGLYQFLLQEIPSSTWVGMASQKAEDLGVSVVETNLRRWLRAYGTFSHPNILGAWLVLSLMLVVDKMKKQSQSLIDVLRYPIYIILLFGLLMSFSRSAWLGFLVFLILMSLRGVMYSGRRSNPLGHTRGMPIVDWILTKRDANFVDKIVEHVPSMPEGSAVTPPRNDTEEERCNETEKEERCNETRENVPCSEERIGIIKIWFATILCVLSFSIIFSDPFVGRFTSTNRLEAKSNAERVASMQDSWQIIKHNPIMGVGMGNYGLAVYRQIDDSQQAWFYQPVHNVFLLVWAELGVVGVVLVLLFVFLSLRAIRMAHLFRHPDPPNRRASEAEGSLWFSAGIFLIPLLIIALFDHYLWSLYSGMMISAVFVGIYVLYAREQMRA